MSTTYELRARDDTGTEKGRVGMGMPVDDVITSLSYYKALHRPGVLKLGCNATHPIIDLLELNGQLEVWRKPEDQDAYPDFFALYLKDYDYTFKDGAFEFLAIMPGHLDLLRWGIVAWAAETSNRSAFSSVAAETIAKDIAEYNVTSSATAAAGRELDWQSPFTVVIETDGGGGNSLNWNCAWDEVIETLEKLATVGGGDFDLIRDPDDDGSYTKFEFRWYSGQRGRDLTSDVIIDVYRGNMGNVKYSHRGSQEITAAIVGGRGRKDERDIEVRTSAADGATLHREAFVNATQYEKGNTAGLQAAGDAFLDEHGSAEAFSFDVLQTEKTRYGVHYGINAAGDLGVLGDLITVIRPHDRDVQTHKITGVAVSLDEDGGESIKVETEQQ
jgi:hypothetical protein